MSSMYLNHKDGLYSDSFIVSSISDINKMIHRGENLVPITVLVHNKCLFPES